ncbi:MAG: glycosyltransferase family 2 protein [candidate division WOR-3 bacterium]
MKITCLISLDALRIMIFILVQVLIALGNVFLLKKLEKFPKGLTTLKVSVLIPVRNEELTIKECLNSILQQSYENFEVLVLDDNSQDKSLEIISSIKSDKLRVFKGEDLPWGWNGKAWASHQLAKQANGDLLLFTDADTKHHKDTLSYAVSALVKTKADLLTIINKNEVKSLGEKVTVPYLVPGVF